MLGPGTQGMLQRAWSPYVLCQQRNIPFPWALHSTAPICFSSSITLHSRPFLPSHLSTCCASHHCFNTWGLFTPPWFAKYYSLCLARTFPPHFLYLTQKRLPQASWLPWPKVTFAVGVPLSSYCFFPFPLDLSTSPLSCPLIIQFLCVPTLSNWDSDWQHLQKCIEHFYLSVSSLRL